MKKLICCMLALLMVMSVMSAAAFAAGEDTLVIYSARNERLNNIVIPAFEAKTGIKVEMITGSSGEVLQRVKAEVESGNVTVDIHWAADETSWRPIVICLKSMSPLRMMLFVPLSRMTAQTASTMPMPSRT